MGTYLEARRDYLRQCQNADGGWGYFRGKQSWLEPTAYSMLALHGDSASAQHCERAWKLIRSWQTPEGGWKPNAQVPNPGWVTALALLLHCVNGVHDSAFHKGVEWLAGTSGAENNLLGRLILMIRPSVIELDRSLQGWPWLPQTSSWVEPTAHAVLALKKAAPHLKSGQVNMRIDDGERLLLDRRCQDGGWNYGNRKVLSVSLPSYPETTAIALMGLQGCKADLGTSLALGKRYFHEAKPGMARAWLTIALRNFGQLSGVPEAADQELSADHLVLALEAIGAEGGNYGLLRAKEGA